jgi:acyl carrier protein
MDEPTLRHLMRELLVQRAQALGLDASDLRDDLDLVRSGLLDSLAFVDLLATLEQRTGRVIDLESALAGGGGTRFGAVVRLFSERP